MHYHTPYSSNASSIRLRPFESQRCWERPLTAENEGPQKTHQHETENLPLTNGRQHLEYHVQLGLTSEYPLLSKDLFNVAPCQPSNLFQADRVVLMRFTLSTQTRCCMSSRFLRNSSLLLRMMYRRHRCVQQTAPSRYCVVVDTTYVVGIHDSINVAQRKRPWCTKMTVLWPRVAHWLEVPYNTHLVVGSILRARLTELSISSGSINCYQTCLWG